MKAKISKNRSLLSGFFSTMIFILIVVFAGMFVTGMLQAFGIDVNFIR